LLTAIVQNVLQKQVTEFSKCSFPNYFFVFSLSPLALSLDVSANPMDVLHVQLHSSIFAEEILLFFNAY